MTFIEEKAKTLAGIVEAVSCNKEVGQQVEKALVAMYELGKSEGFAEGMKRGTDVTLKTQAMIFDSLGVGK